jgi:hypothetical protein
MLLKLLFREFPAPEKEVSRVRVAFWGGDLLQLLLVGVLLVSREKQTEELR